MWLTLAQGHPDWIPDWVNDTSVPPAYVPGTSDWCSTAHSCFQKIFSNMSECRWTQQDLNEVKMLGIACGCLFFCPSLARTFRSWRSTVQFAALCLILINGGFKPIHVLGPAAHQLIGRPLLRGMGVATADQTRMLKYIPHMTLADGPYSGLDVFVYAQAIGRITIGGDPGGVPGYCLKRTLQSEWVPPPPTNLCRRQRSYDPHLPHPTSHPQLIPSSPTSPPT
jgi:hypothetical protein